MENEALTSFILELGNFAYESFFSRNYEVFQKSKNDYVTSVDLKISEKIDLELSKLYPSDFFLTEEKEVLDKRFDFKRVWICDPIDGTTEFINGSSEFAISLGLSENKKSILAYIFNPITGELFYNYNTQLYYNILSYPYVKLNLNPFLIKNQSLCEKPRLYISKNELRKGYFSDKFWIDKFNLHPKSSIAYKLALLAVDICDLVLSFNVKNEWDICAGISLLNSRDDMIALELKTEKEFSFNNEILQTDGLIAGKKDLVYKYLPIIQSMYKKIIS